MERQQQVIVEGEFSDSCSVDSGAPQGRVLGPVLFLCHINDLPSRVNSTVRLFADGCLLYKTTRAIQDQIQLQKQGYRYHKLRKTFSKFYRRYYDLISKFQVGL